LYAEVDNVPRRRARAQFSLERKALRRVDGIYAPSNFVACHYERLFGRPVAVIRPPRPSVPATDSLLSVSEVATTRRYLVHFGQLSARKGTDVVADALLHAWQEVPDLQMVWVGKTYYPELLENWLQRLGEKRHQVRVLPSQPRDRLFAILRGAEAAVLPSRVDNLPNTVIESLSLGVPVIGTTNSSIDELVEDGITGHLVPRGDAKTLAARMVDMWNGRGAVARGFEWRSPICSEMEPARAIASLLDFGKEGTLP